MPVNDQSAAIPWSGSTTYPDGTVGKGLKDAVSGTVADNAVTNAKLADVAEGTWKGRLPGAGSGDPTDNTISAYGADFIAAADATAARVLLELIKGTDVQVYNALLAAIAGLGASGLVARTGAGTAEARTITAGSTKIGITNGDGVAGDPTIDVNQGNLSLTSIGGTLSVAKGGTGGTDAAAARTNLGVAYASAAEVRTGTETGKVVAPANLTPKECWCIPCSDETSALTTGTNKVRFRAPYAFKVSAVRASVNTAPTGSTLIVDINEEGTTILSTKLSIDASEKTSTSAATAAVISDPDIADDAEVEIDIDQIGSTIAGAGLKVYLLGNRVP